MLMNGTLHDVLPWRAATELDVRMGRRLMVIGIQHDTWHCLLTGQGLGRVAELSQERGRGYLVWLRVIASKGKDGGVLCLAACPAGIMGLL